MTIHCDIARDKDMSVITFKCTECDKIFSKQEEEIIHNKSIVRCPYCGNEKYIGQFSPALERQINNGRKKKQEEIDL